MQALNVAEQDLDVPRTFCNYYKFQKAANQIFSIPEGIIFYIAKNPTTSKLWQKLIQTCKYFFHKNSVVVMDGLDRIYPNYGYPDTRSDFIPTWEACLVNETRVKVNLDKNLFKLWLIGRLAQSEPTLPRLTISALIPKIYRCDLVRLHINHQKLTFKEFIYLTSNPDFNSLVGTVVDVVDSHETNVIIPFEKIIAKLPKIVDIKW